MYEVTFIDTGKTFYWSRQECDEHFGIDEFPEYRDGYLPHVVVCQVTEEN
jgi:hypothetical protein